MKFNRNLEELTQHASLHWTEELISAAAKETILHDLLSTQDEFISVLKVASKTPLSWLSVLEQTEALSLQLFTKHLMVLTDLGGETLNKILPIEEYFPDLSMEISWNNEQFNYSFQAIHNAKSLTNTSLKLTKKTINSPCNRELLIDLSMILLFGSKAKNSYLPSEYGSKTIIGALLGQNEKIERYVESNYIRISSQIKGANSNALGHFAQHFVYEHLSEYLPDDWTVRLEGSLSGVQHIQEEGSSSNFDIVCISPSHVEFAVEVSFQVTTNSVIERKARDSSAIFQRANALNHHICYVIDGAGNINIRKRAVETICTHSKCTVALSSEEIKHLANYMLANG